MTPHRPPEQAKSHVFAKPLVVSGILLIIVSVVESLWGHRAFQLAIAMTVLLLLCSVVMTYRANYEYSQEDHTRRGSIRDNLVSSAIVYLDTGSHNARLRCNIAKDYIDGTRSVEMAARLNDLTISLYREPFCSEFNVENWNGLFADDDGSPHEKDIEVLAARGITAGCVEHADISLYCPNKGVDTLHLLIFLDRMAGMGIIEQSTADTLRLVPPGGLTRAYVTRFVVDASPHLVPIKKPEGLFVDIEDTELVGYAEAIYHADIDKGCSQELRHYCPNKSMTRGELASFLVRAFKITDRSS